MKCETCGKKEATNFSHSYAKESRWLIECYNCHQKHIGLISIGWTKWIGRSTCPTSIGLIG